MRTDIETGRKLLQGVSPYFPPSTDSADAAAPKPVCDGMGGPKPPTFNPGNCSSYNLGMCHSGEQLPKAPAVLHPACSGMTWTSTPGGWYALQPMLTGSRSRRSA